MGDHLGILGAVGFLPRFFFLFLFFFFIEGRVWSTAKNTIASTLCWNSVLGLSKRGFLVQSPPSLTCGGVDSLSTLSPRADWSALGAVLCASALLTAHPMVHQTSLIKGKCKDELFHS